MNEHDHDRLPPDLDERFFARQRAEIMARVTAAPRRRAARLALPLAAAALAGTVALGWYATRGPAVETGDWLFAWDLPAVVNEAPDALVAFDPASELADLDDFESDLPFVLPSFEEMSGLDSAASDDDAPSTTVPESGNPQRG
jgi:hypothetical protein